MGKRWLWYIYVTVWYIQYTPFSIPRHTLELFPTPLLAKGFDKTSAGI